MKKTSNQLKIKDLVKILKNSKVPWLWVLLTFLLNVYYNQLLYKLPISTGKLMAGDLSSAALVETLVYYGTFAVLTVMQSFIVAYAYAVTTRRARVQLWGKMLKIDEKYFDSVESSEMLSAVTVDLGSAMPSVINLIVAVIPDLFYVFIALREITSYDAILLLTLVAFLPFKYIYSLVFGRINYKVENRVLMRVGELTSKIGERIENLAMVKSFNKEEQELEVTGESIEELYKANVAVAKVGGISLVAEYVIEILQQFITLVVAVILLQKGRITMEQWIAFFLFTTNISSKISTLMADWVSLKTISGSLARTKSLYDADEENPVEDGVSADSLENYDIKFDDVVFAYEGDLALDHVSFEIPAGQKVAIVGNCGSGKSTTLSLIERFYTPKSGKVLLGGQDVSAMKLEEYRSNIAYVPQQNQVFSGSIREVLKYGNNKELTDKDLLEASEKTGFADYLELQPQGLDAPVTDGGENMSGGQLQRMVITRETLRDVKVVLFDEPTSALDAESSKNIKKLLMEGMPDKTVIVVTHDLSLTDQMDQIILLDDGNLLGTGTYEELLEGNEKFRELVESQSVEEVTL